MHSIDSTRVLSNAFTNRYPQVSRLTECYPDVLASFDQTAIRPPKSIEEYMTVGVVVLRGVLGQGFTAQMINEARDGEFNHRGFGKAENTREVLVSAFVNLNGDSARAHFGAAYAELFPARPGQGVRVLTNEFRDGTTDFMDAHIDDLTNAPTLLTASGGGYLAFDLNGDQAVELFDQRHDNGETVNISYGSTDLLFSDGTVVHKPYPEPGQDRYSILVSRLDYTKAINRL
jgi:hypothetical protein